MWVLLFALCVYKWTSSGEEWRHLLSLKYFTLSSEASRKYNVRIV
jgi:hypothetical protein